MQYQIRRGGNVGPNSYTVDQLKEMYAGGSLVLTDEVSPAGQNQWKPLNQAFAGGQAAAAAPALAAGGDWLMKADLMRWIFRGCLMLTVLSVVLPWWSVSDPTGRGGGESWLGIVQLPGIIAFIFAGAALGGTWAPLPIRQFLFIGAALALLLTLAALFGFGSPTPESGGPTLVEGLAIIADRGGPSLGWRGMGMFIGLIGSLGATTFGVFIFLQHLKKRPCW